MARIGTFYFNVKTDQLMQRVEKIRNYYVDISDQGNKRLSKRCAIDFLEYLKDAMITGKYASSVPALSESYVKWKNFKVGGGPMMMYTTDLYTNMEVFRSRTGGDANRRGHVVGVKDSFEQDKLEAFEYGTGPKGGSWRAGAQPPRPIFSMALDDFLNEKFDGIITQFVPSKV